MKDYRIDEYELKSIAEQGYNAAILKMFSVLKDKFSEDNEDA